MPEIEDDPKNFSVPAPGGIFFAGWVIAIVVALVATAGLVLARELWIGRQTSELQSENQAGPHVLVADVLQLFRCAIQDEKKAGRARAQTTLKEVAARALVTKDGVYAFLETPENKLALKGVQPGTAVSIKGRLLGSGALLHIDSLAKARGLVDNAKKLLVQRVNAQGGQRGQ